MTLTSTNSLLTPTSRLQFNASGSISSLSFLTGDSWQQVVFRQDEHSGPGWHIDQAGEDYAIALNAADQPGCFQGDWSTIRFSLCYRLLADRLEITASLENAGVAPFAPRRCSVRLGLDTYMAAYPEWDERYFPTLLRCEKTHFWGYSMSPVGRILGVASPDPIASWSLAYNFAMYGSERHEGHRIYTFDLDLLQAPPLPSHHPQTLDQLGPGERKSWTITLIPLEDLSQVQPVLAQICHAPMITSDRFTLLPGEQTCLRVFGAEDARLEAHKPDGSHENLTESARGQGWQEYRFQAGAQAGVTILTAQNGQGKQAEARLYTRRQWSWYLQQARAEAVRMPQKASTHMESWLGFFSAYLARKHFPDLTLDSQIDSRFAEVLPLMFDLDKGEPIVEAGRIQNTAAMIGLLADVYMATEKIEFLDLATRLADWLCGAQDDNGAYRAHYGNGVHYTSVTYLAKYMIELTLVERNLGEHQPLWQERADRHFASAARAIDDLERLRDNIGTEGEHTFEDGMIACTAAQLGLFALLQSDAVQREKYNQAAGFVLWKHRCLRQLLIPDCRMNGATLRFWEAQYDVLIKGHNMLNSPHGWTSWKTYATWYLYQLTGEESLLRETMDTLGACMQMVDVNTGELRWAFVPDPAISARQFCPDPQNLRQGVYVETILGGQYIPMISDWWQANPNHSTGGYWDQGGCCDNDVHEHFKCLEEVALTSAYVIEQSNGDFHCWNCTVEDSEAALRIRAAEPMVKNVHLNLIHPHTVLFEEMKVDATPGSAWLS